MAPSPLIKMDIYLSEKNRIIYDPTRHELEDTFTTVLEEIIHLLSTVPRLYEKFGLPAGGLKKFKEVITSDPDSNKLQNLIDTGRYIIYVQVLNACSWELTADFWMSNVNVGLVGGVD